MVYRRETRRREHGIPGKRPRPTSLRRPRLPAQRLEAGVSEFAVACYLTISPELSSTGPRAGTPNGCELVCTWPDQDNDGLPDDCDLCPGFPDDIDSDGDGRADGCDLCPGADDLVDAEVTLSDGQVVPVGQGDGRVRDLLADLLEEGFDGVLCVEPHLSDMSGPDAFRTAVRALKEILDDIGAEYV